MSVVYTTKLRLAKPGGGTHPWSMDEYTTNLDTIDASPGVLICTSSTRPVSWAAAQAGREIYESDTKLLWRWTGTYFERSAALGLLEHATLGAPAEVTSTAPEEVLSTTVVVPPSHTGVLPRLRVSAQWYAVSNGNDTSFGAAEVSLLQTGVVLTKVRVTGRPSTAGDPYLWGSGGRIEALWRPPDIGGTINFALAINSISSVGGSTVMTNPAHLTIEEVGL